MFHFSTFYIVTANNEKSPIDCMLFEHIDFCNVSFRVKGANSEIPILGPMGGLKLNSCIHEI